MTETLSAELASVKLQSKTSPASYPLRLDDDTSSYPVRLDDDHEIDIMDRIHAQNAAKDQEEAERKIPG